MSNSTNQKQGEQLNTQNSAEETHKSNSYKLIDREAMENTPFVIVGNEDTGYFGTLGKYKITENFPTKEAVTNHVETYTWEIIMKIVAIIAQDLIDMHDKIISKQNPIS